MQTPDLTDRLIARHVGLAMGAATLPVPVADLAAVTWVQIDLVRRLAERYAVDADATRTRAAVLALAGAGFARLGASLVKAVPGAGWLVGAGTHAALAGATTWALGQAYREHFERRGSLEGPDADALRERYEAYVARGRALARELRERVRFDDELDAEAERLARLSRLQRAGILTEEEFRRLVEPPGEPE